MTYPHRWRATRGSAVLYDGVADVQDGETIRRDPEGLPMERGARVFLADERPVGTFRIGDVGVVTWAPSDTARAQVVDVRRLDGSLLVRWVPDGDAAQGLEFPDLCTRSIPGAFVEDGEGGGSYGAPTTETFPCRTVRVTSEPAEGPRGERMVDPTALDMHYPGDVDLSAGETVAVTRADDDSTERYRVVNVAPRSTHSTTGVARLERVGAFG